MNEVPVVMGTIPSAESVRLYHIGVKLQENSLPLVNDFLNRIITPVSYTHLTLPTILRV